jgi:hypothetical protein
MASGAAKFHMPPSGKRQMLPIGCTLALLAAHSSAAVGVSGWRKIAETGPVGAVL